MHTQSILTLNPLDLLKEAIEDFTTRYSPRFIGYTPHQKIYIETNQYILKSADNMNELLNAFKLRHENFLESEEDGTTHYDLDEFDHQCDHLIIKDKMTDEVVGTYRILCSLYHDSFYSQHEFNLDKFLETEGVKIELGRACINYEHRNGVVIDLLWRGISKYAELVNATYLFGCSSIKVEDTQNAYNLYEYYKSCDYLSEEYAISPTPKFHMDFSHCKEMDNAHCKSLTPSLLKSYITAGAKINGAPALDKEFHCIDFFTILEIPKVTRLFKKRYFKWLI